MSANGIANILSEFALLPRAFTTQELLEFADPETDHEVLQRALLNDKRFVALGQEASDQYFFVPEITLFRRFIYLSFRLAQARQARLNTSQLANYMSSLRLDGRWDAPPVQAVNFGHQFGFVASAWTPGQYVFPLARLMLHLVPYRVEAAILEIFAKKENQNADYQKPIEYWAKEALSRFDECGVYVVQRREGLSTGARATLEEIGADLGITRERVRQIEKRTWKRLQHPANLTPFLKGFLYEIMRRQGSLVISAEESSLRFLAKCIGIPQVEVPHTGLVILGALRKDIASMESLWRRPQLFDVDTIATRLESECRLCLSEPDLRVVSERVARSHWERPTKTQRVYLALRSIGKPAHYAEVWEEYNRLFPDEPSTEHNIHATLLREEHGVVWIGVKGTFALEEWGYQRPSKTLFEIVTEIVKKIYEHTGKPVPFHVIMAEVGKYRQLVNPVSLVFATHFNPNLQRVFKDSFVPKGPDDQVQDETSEDELDQILREFEERENSHEQPP